jgi:hypothetical protein
VYAKGKNVLTFRIWCNGTKNSGAPEGKAIPASLVTPILPIIMLYLLDIIA